MFDLKVIQHISTISETTKYGKSLQLNVVSVNNGPDMIDLARWYIDENGAVKRKGGVILNNAEYEQLKKVMDELF